MTEPITLRREWRAEARADGWYVIETGDSLGGHHIAYGPMPPDYVLPLISECRDAFEEAVKNHAGMMMAKAMAC